MSKCNFFVLLFFLCLSGHSYGGATGTIIKICGSGDNQELLRQLARAYEGHQPGIGIEVPDSIGSRGGVKATARGQCDIGRLARPLQDKEKHYKLSYRLFARSPVVFFVSANLNSITNITAQQAVRIFSGKMRSWQDMGGPDAKIYIANREKGDSGRTVLEKHLVDFALIEKAAGKTIYSTPETVNIVAGHDNTIAYGALSSVIKRPGLHVLGFEGTMPSVEAITERQYPMASDFGLVWRADISDKAMAFIKFLETKEAREIIAGYGAAPVTAENI